MTVCARDRFHNPSIPLWGFSSKGSKNGSRKPESRVDRCSGRLPMIISPSSDEAHPCLPIFGGAASLDGSTTQIIDLPRGRPLLSLLLLLLLLLLGYDFPRNRMKENSED